MKVNRIGRLKTVFGIGSGSGVLGLFLFVIVMNCLPMQDFVLSDSTIDVVEPVVQEQKRIEAEIRAYYENGSFSFERPLVIQNPYKTAPLTALIIFDTPEALRISVEVPGKTPQAAVHFSSAVYQKHHETPIYGLYAGMVNRVRLTATDEQGGSSETVVEIETEPLPVYIDTLQVFQSDPEQFQPGMNFTFLEHKVVYDMSGDVRWFSTRSTFQTYTPVANGHYLFTYLVDGGENDILMEQDLLGKTYAVYNLPGGVHHDIIELPSGNVMATSEDPSSEYSMDELIEVDRRTGEIIRTIDLKQYLDPYRTNEIELPQSDWLHLNSIFYDPDGQSIIISSRAQSAVVKMTYPEMEIQWILGPHDNWVEGFKPYLLEPTGESFEWQWSQHHATIVARGYDASSTWVDVLLFDNGNYRSFSEDTALTAQESYSRMVMYRVDETNHTVTQVWEYGKERGSDLFSISRGSAYLLANGNLFGDWAELARDKDGRVSIEQQDDGSISSRMIEVNPRTGRVVFEASLAGVVNYRAIRADLYSAVTVGESVLAQKLNDTTAYRLDRQIITILQPVKVWYDPIQQGVKLLVKRMLQRSGLW